MNLNWLKHRVQREEGKLSFFSICLIAVLSALIPIALIGWKEVYNSVLETSAPEIYFDEIPRGIGQAPVRLVIRAVDRSSGLDEIVVRAKQRGAIREIDRQSLDGQEEAVLNLEFPGKQSGFQEGKVEFDVRVFDRSFWSNRGEKKLTIMVDYRSPVVEVISQQHNARAGGSQLVFYKAVDENLSVSGVRIGSKVFEGYQARLLDTDFTDPNIFFATYALPLQLPESGNIVPRVFAEDVVGNPKSATFYNKIARRTLRKRKVPLTEAYLRDSVHSIAEINQNEIRKILKEQSGKEFEFQTADGSTERLLEEFQIINNQLRRADLVRLAPYYKNSRFQRYWQQPFLSQAGVVNYGYSEQLVFFGGNRAVADHVQTGHTYRDRSSGGEVYAANGGVVLFVERLGALGLTMGIDHGLGLSTIYGHLQKTYVTKGDQVAVGDVIGDMGRSGLIESNGVFFQILIQGVPVEPAEWISRSWFRDHITNKIRQVKKLLGIQILDPF